MISDEELAEGIKKDKRGISLVWVAPLIALLITGGMLLKNFIDAGTRISIIFNNADGIRNGKTPIMYKGIQVGVVEEIHIKNDDVSKLELTALIDKSAADGVTREGNKFWKVEPKISMTEVSGLGTIISGIYIAVMPAVNNREELHKLPFQDHFIAQSSAPVDIFNPGLSIVVNTVNKGDIAIGAPLLYNKQAIGKVEDKKISLDKKSIDLYLRVDTKYIDLIHDKSMFYKANAVDFKANLDRVNLSMGSFATFIAGGVTVYNDTQALSSSRASAKSKFHLFDNYEEMILSKEGFRLTLHTKDAINVKEGVGVFYKNIKIGTVSSVELMQKDSSFNIELIINSKYREFLNQSSRFYSNGGVEFTASLSKVELKAGSIESILHGGISVETFNNEASSTLKKSYTLYKSKKEMIEKQNFHANGLYLDLYTKEVNSLKHGSPVLFNQLVVGEIISTKWLTNEKRFLVKIFINEEYAKEVSKNSLFYNASGMHARLGLNGIELDMQSIETIVSGGISFYTPAEKLNKKVKNNEKFLLFSSQKEAMNKYVDVFLLAPHSAGLSKGSVLKYKGLVIGHVENIKIMNENLEFTVKVQSMHKSLINKEAVFWLEKLEIGLGGIENSDALLKGPYIVLKPGRTKGILEHYNLMLETPLPHLNEEGLRVVLNASRLASVKENTSVYYRQIKIGSVVQHRLKDDSTGVDIEIFIDPCYAHLIRSNSYFYNASGIGMEVSLTGAKIKTESMESILSGGIGVLTPDNYTEQASEAQVFTLNDEFDEAALSWKPKLYSTNEMCQF